MTPLDGVVSPPGTNTLPFIRFAYARIISAEYIGCYGLGGGMSEKTDSWWMTIGKCRQYCRSNWYTYFGLKV